MLKAGLVEVRCFKHDQRGEDSREAEENEHLQGREFAVAAQDKEIERAGEDIGEQGCVEEDRNGDDAGAEPGPEIRMVGIGHEGAEEERRGSNAEGGDEREGGRHGCEPEGEVVDAVVAFLWRGWGALGAAARGHGGIVARGTGRGDQELGFWRSTSSKNRPRAAAYAESEAERRS